MTTGQAVQVSGFQVGEVKSIELDGPRVLVTFTVAKDIRLGDRTEAAIKTKSLLGTKILEVTPRGDGQQEGTIPVERTTSPYQLPDALGDLATTISGLNTDQLSDSLRVLAETFSDTPPELKVAVEGVARFSQTLDERDAQLRNLLTNANKATTVLAERSDQVVEPDRQHQRAAGRAGKPKRRTGSDLRQHLGAQRSTDGLHRREPRDHETCAGQAQRRADDRRQPQGTLQKSIKLLGQYSMSLGESVSSGPFFKAYVANLLPGQFVQPFVDAAFSDLGLDPNVLLPSQLTDPQIGQPGTPALPVPYPRTGQGGEPRLTIPDAITGNPGDQGCGPPGLPLPGPPAAIPTASRRPRRRRAARRRDRPRAAPPGCESTPEPTPSPRYWCPRPVRCRHLAPRGGRDDDARARRICAGRRAGGGTGRAAWSCWCARTERSTAHTSSPTSTTATASTPATTCASSACPSGRIESIEPQPSAVKITFWYDDKYKVPADAKAVILSPSLVTARAIQLTPAYTGGPVMDDTR